MRWLLVLVIAGCAPTQPVSDWERQNRQSLISEDTAPPPPYPRQADLIEFYVSPTAEFKYFVDARSLSVGADRIVRFTLVARSPSGVDNVSYEGLRCPREHRLYAVARAEGSWSGRDSDWREFARGTSLGWQYALAQHFFCPHRDPIRSATEGIDALRRGSHPSVYVDPKNLGGGN
ncbi:MAG TPA: CNP1-like family protein [Burkholderiales bacterium]|nr:CNP1-like family protein [Burkholderiales bacterium]